MNAEDMFDLLDDDETAVPETEPTLEQTVATLVEQVATLTKRCDGQRDAIIALRKHLGLPADGTKKKVSAASDTPAGGGDPYGPGIVTQGVQGVFVPRDTCVICGGPNPRRTAMSCKRCSDVRRERLAPGSTNRPAYPRCLNCGTPKGKTPAMNCGPCSKAFKAYKDEI